MIEPIASATDPICGMTVNKATALHAEHDGATFYFCCDECRHEFLAAPDEIILEEEC